MPCRLCTGETYAIEVETQADYERMLSFFKNGHLEDYLVLYDKKDEYKGLVTYKSLSKSMGGGGYNTR